MNPVGVAEGAWRSAWDSTVEFAEELSRAVVNDIHQASVLWPVEPCALPVVLCVTSSTDSIQLSYAIFERCSQLYLLAWSNDSNCLSWSWVADYYL